MSYDAPFEGLRVVDLSQGIAGPYCAMLLAQHGADVVKVEPPAGDWARELGTRYGDQSAFSLAANLGKRGIVADLKEERGRLVVRRLIERADVFMESFRPGVAARLGLGYDAVSAVTRASSTCPSPASARPAPIASARPWTRSSRPSPA